MAIYTSSPSTPGGGSFLKKSTLIWGAIAIVVIIFLVGGCSSYNGMVKDEEAVSNTWAKVQAAYQRRFDLIPNLVNTVKGYAAHESSTLQNVTDARAGLIATGDSLVKASKALKSFSPDADSTPSTATLESLNRGMSLYINAVHEAYPDLKANENFLDLQKQLEATENRINTERNLYNDAVKNYNIQIRTFPRNIFAGMFGFDRKQPFAADDEAQQAPEVKF